MVMNPGFSGIGKNDYRSHRGWPIEHWVALAKMVSQHAGLRVAINGTEDERPLFEPLLALPGLGRHGNHAPVIGAGNACRCTVRTHHSGIDGAIFKDSASQSAQQRYRLPALLSNGRAKAMHF